MAIIATADWTLKTAALTVSCRYSLGYSVGQWAEVLRDPDLAVMFLLLTIEALCPAAAHRATNRRKGEELYAALAGRGDFAADKTSRRLYYDSLSSIISGPAGARCHGNELLPRAAHLPHLNKWPAVAVAASLSVLSQEIFQGPFSLSLPPTSF